MSTTDHTTDEMSFFEKVPGRKRKRSTPKGCDGRPALNGSKAPTYITNEKGEFKRLGRRDIKDIPNNAMVLRYVGDGAPDVSALSDAQRRGEEPLSADWQFVPVFAHVAGKRRGQIIEQYELGLIQHNVDFDVALDAWMRHSAQDESVATRDHLLFMIHMHNSTVRDEHDLGHGYERSINPPGIEGVKQLVSYLDELGIREAVSESYYSLLSTVGDHHFLAEEKSGAPARELYRWSGMQLHAFLELAPELMKMDRRAAKWAAEDFLLIDPDNVRTNWLGGDLYTNAARPSKERILEDFAPTYAGWIHDEVFMNPGVLPLIERYRVSVARTDARDTALPLIENLLHHCAEQDPTAERLRRAILALPDSFSNHHDFPQVLMNATVMLSSWPVKSLSDEEVTFLLSSRPDVVDVLSGQHGDSMQADIRRGDFGMTYEVSLQEAKRAMVAGRVSAAFRKTIAPHTARDIIDALECSPEATAQLIILTTDPRSPLHEKADLDVLRSVANDAIAAMKEEGVDADTAVLAATAVMARRGFDAAADRDAEIQAACRALRDGRTTLARVQEGATSQERLDLCYDVKVSPDLGRVPTYGIEWTRPVSGTVLLGNLDPQHDGGRDQRAAIEAALDAPLPPRGVTLQTVRADLDAFGAMAVFAARADGEDLSDPQVRQRVSTIAAADRREDLDTTWQSRAYDPEFIQNEEIVGLSRTIRELEPQDAVGALRQWLRTGELPSHAARVIEERRSSQRAMAARYRAQVLDGSSVLHDGAVRWAAALDVAPDVVYQDAPVAALSRGSDTDGFKHTLAVHPGYEWRIPASLTQALNQREAELGGTPEWGGPNNGTLLGSPQRGNSRISVQEFRRIIEQHLN